MAKQPMSCHETNQESKDIPFGKQQQHQQQNKKQ